MDVLSSAYASLQETSTGMRQASANKSEIAFASFEGFFSGQCAGGLPDIKFGTQRMESERRVTSPSHQIYGVFCCLCGR